MSGSSGGALRRLFQVLAALLALTLVATACGSDSDDADTGADNGGTEAPDEEVDTGTEDEVTETTLPQQDVEVATTEAGTTINRGGTLTVVLEAETDTWNIPAAACAVSCITIMQQVADPLTIVNSDGEVEPFLAESVDISDDFTTYTIKLREGITFHNGSPANADAMVRHFQAMAAGTLQGQVMTDILGTAEAGYLDGGMEIIDDLTISITFGKPYATFGYNIAGRTGWLMAPEFWDSETVASDTPIATGAFEMTEWTIDEQTVLTANANYWRTDADGEALPYLEEIVVRPVPDVSARQAIMEAGDAQVNADSFAENGDFWENEWEGGNLQPSEREVTYLLLNNAEGSPFANPDVRKAIAQCTDRDEYIALRAPGNELANGPFAPEALGFLDESTFPEFDPEAGATLLASTGVTAISYGTTNVPSNLITAELFADMWSQNCGIEVNIDQFDQSELITRAITGNFEVFLWRNHGQGNPGLEYVWWNSRHASGLALNFGRIIDPELDALLEQTWQTSDLDELDSLGQDISRLFGDNVYNIWLGHTEWNLPFQANVNGVGNIDTPSGNKANPSFAGRMWLTQAWISQ